MYKFCFANSLRYPGFDVTPKDSLGKVFESGFAAENGQHTTYSNTM